MNELGGLRPSQLIFTFGVGSLVDLPNMSAIVLGLDDWDTRYCAEIAEDRLVAAIQKRLGPQMTTLFLPPIKLDGMERDPAAPAVGVPVAPFPRWLRCSLCDTLAKVESGIFKLIQDQWRPDRTEYVHQGCLKGRRGRPPSALSVRFLLACREGHLTDFPWVDFIHNGKFPCKPASLSLREFGASGDASDIIAKCHTCGLERRMADAFDIDNQITCSGHHPHLRSVDKQQCKESARTILLGSANSWFPTPLSALSLPEAEDRLGRLVEEHWVDLKETDEINEIRLLRKRLQKFQSLIPLFTEFKDQDIWEAIETKRKGPGRREDVPEDLKLPEWRTFSSPGAAAESRDFRIKRVDPPKGFETLFEDTILVERIREVRALLGFTRIANADFTEATILTDGRLTRLSRESPRWLPASEVRDRKFNSLSASSWNLIERGGGSVSSDLLISDGCDWSGVIAKLFAKSMRPTRKQGDGERYEAESRGFWDDGWERGVRFFSSPHRERPFHAPASSTDVSDRRDPHHQRIGV